MRLVGAFNSSLSRYAFDREGGRSDRIHPARKQLPKLAGNNRAFAQAAWRHLLFGVLLGDGTPHRLPDGSWQLYDDVRG